MLNLEKYFKKPKFVYIVKIVARVEEQFKKARKYFWKNPAKIKLL